MSEELYRVLALSARYLFVLLAVLIVIRAFLRMLSDRITRRAELRRLPNAGLMGEFIVISGFGELPEGQAIPVPREGILGSVRSADIFVPCPGVRRSHLFFSFERGRGLLVHPLSGSEALVNSVRVNCKSRPESTSLTHGSFLQVGSAVLRLRMFAGLDSAAGFDGIPQPPSPAPEGSGLWQKPVPSAASLPPVVPAYPPVPPVFPEAHAVPGSPAPAEAFRELPVSPAPRTNGFPSSAPVGNEADPAAASVDEVNHSGSIRRRRSDRWEADWSE